MFLKISIFWSTIYLIYFLLINQKILLAQTPEKTWDANSKQKYKKPNSALAKMQHNNSQTLKL